MKHDIFHTYLIFRHAPLNKAMIQLHKKKQSMTYVDDVANLNPVTKKKCHMCLFCSPKISDKIY